MEMRTESFRPNRLLLASAIVTLFGLCSVDEQYENYPDGLWLNQI
jgi:hypothetical protein